MKRIIRILLFSAFLSIHSIKAVDLSLVYTAFISYCMGYALNMLPEENHPVLSQGIRVFIFATAAIPPLLALKEVLNEEAQDEAISFLVKGLVRFSSVVAGYHIPVNVNYYPQPHEE